MKRVILVLVILFCFGCKSSSIKEVSSDVLVINDDSFYGYLIIPSIDMKLGFYDYDSELNDVNKNIELIKTGIENTYLIAGHSGTGTLAYFNDLRYLELGDEIILEFRDRTYTYAVSNIRREEKDGSITIPNEENYLILTTCDQIVKGYQLIIEAKLKT